MCETHTSQISQIWGSNILHALHIRCTPSYLCTYVYTRPFHTRERLAQGGIDDGELAQDAAFRELREETGVTSAELLGEVGGQEN